MQWKPRTIWYVIAFTLVLAVVVGFDLTPWVRGGYGWRWNYDTAPYVLIPLSFVVGYVAGGLRLIGRGAPGRTLIAWSVTGTILISYATVAAHTGDPLQTMLGRTLDFTTTGQHQAAALMDWDGGEWRDWSAYMRGTDGHIALSPPGAVLWYGLLDASLGAVPLLADTLNDPLLAAQCHNYVFLDYTPAEQASAWFGVLMPLWAALTVLPLYAVARRLTGSDSARWAVLWWALVPGVTGFAASWNTLYPLLAVLAFWLLLRGLDARGVRPMALWLIGAGLVTGLALFINFAFVPLPGVLGVYTLSHYWFRERDAQPLYRPLIVGGWAVLGAVIPWLLFYAVSGDTPFDMLQAALDYHFDLDRPYWFWVGMHLWDFVLWGGVGFALLGVLALFRWRGRPLLLMLALTVTLVILALSGTARGETGRVWLFLAPLLLVAAVDGLRRLADRRSAYVGMTLSQAVLALVLLVNVPVMPDPLTRPPALAKMTPDMFLAFVDTSQIATFTADAHALFRLEGFATQQTGAGVQLALTWQGINRPETAYWFGAFLVGPDGETTEPILWQPRESFGRDARYPTTCWDGGTAVQDRVVLPLPDNAAPGDWWVSLAAFGAAGQLEGRLNVTLSDGSPDVQVGLGPVAVE